MRVAVYPGSFDPVTYGHLDVMERASKIFDKIIIAVVYNVYKNSLFSTDERVEMIRDVTKHIPNVEVDCFSGLLVNYVERRQASAIIRGLRTVSDFEYELQLAMTNSHLYPEVDTIFIACASKYYFVSSSGVKEASLLGGSVEGLVPPLIEQRLKDKLLALNGIS